MIMTPKPESSSPCQGEHNGEPGPTGPTWTHFVKKVVHRDLESTGFGQLDPATSSHPSAVILVFLSDMKCHMHTVLTY